MIKLRKTYLKILVLLAITIAMFIVWQVGYEAIHAKILTGTTNACLKLAGSDKSIKYEVQDAIPIFRVYLIKDGQSTRFPQEIGPLLQPTVIVLAWQLFLFFVLKTRQALRLLLINLVIFIAFQVFFLICLTGYHTSGFQRFMYGLMVDSFYVIALILVIKDNIFHPIFRKG